MVLRTLFVLMLAGGPAAASDICFRAADQAAARHNVPADVMRAITLTETGRRQDGALTPWPWTVNMEGAGHWFDTRAEAMAFVEQHHARGARSYDVGCFQINWRWHSEHFEGLAQMFDPAANADYAARYLTEHFTALGDWSRAAGRYHSGTPEFATRYAARFDQIRAGLGEITPVSEVAIASAQTVRFGLRTTTGPLLRRASGPLFGSN